MHPERDQSTVLYCTTPLQKIVIHLKDKSSIIIVSAMDRNEYNRYDSGNYNQDEEDDNYDQDTQTTSPSGRGDSRQQHQLSSHGQASSHSRLKVTNEGLLDPDLLSRTEGYMYKKGLFYR